MTLGIIGLNKNGVVIGADKRNIHADDNKPKSYTYHDSAIKVRKITPQIGITLAGNATSLGDDIFNIVSATSDEPDIYNLAYSIERTLRLFGDARQSFRCSTMLAGYKNPSEKTPIALYIGSYGNYNHIQLRNNTLHGIGCSSLLKMLEKPNEIERELLANTEYQDDLEQVISIIGKEGDCSNLTLQEMESVIKKIILLTHILQTKSPNKEKYGGDNILHFPTVSKESEVITIVPNSNSSS